MGYLIVFFAGTLVGIFLTTLLAGCNGRRPVADRERKELYECLD